MLTEKHLTNSIVISPDSLLKYYQWNISANGEPLNIIFKKTISKGSKTSERSADSGFSIFEEDLEKAMQLYRRHVASKGRIPFEMVLRYNAGNGAIYYKLCKASITEWSNQGNALKMEGCLMD